MDDLGNFIDFPSPANSMYYVYGDSEQYLSESQSPHNSTYDMASAGRSRYPSPGHGEGEEEEEEEATDPADQQKPAATKRKRENRYKNAPPAVLSRRRAQNRASQRAYRERKDQRIKDLERLLDDAQQRNDVLGQAYTALQAEYVALKVARTSDPGYHLQPFDVLYSSRQTPANDIGLGTGGIGAVGLDMFVYSRGVDRGCI